MQNLKHWIRKFWKANLKNNAEGVATFCDKAVRPSSNQKQKWLQITQSQ